MPEVKPVERMKELADALAAFCKKNSGGNPSYDVQIQKATMIYKASLETVAEESKNKGTTVVGAAQALLDFIQRPYDKTRITKPYPKEQP
jgi:hypothetical protein